MRSPAAARLLIVDDHSVVREGLHLILEREPDFTVVAAVATGEDAIEVFKRERPDIVLMDLQLPGISGAEAIRGIREIDPKARVVVLSMFSGDEDLFRAFEAGAVSYLLKGSPSEHLVRVLREVLRGGAPVPEELKARLDERADRSTLTPRETTVLHLVMEGLRNKEIGAQLSIREETVEVHLKNIFTKLDVHDRTAAVYVALRRGILHVK